jgi:CRISPR system Cascade subunit CasD
MATFLHLRLSSPLMVAGTAAVDTHRYTDTLPSQSLLTGMVANALGYRHSDPRHNEIQRALEFAARSDRPGTHLVDYQTVQISPRSDRAWTTHGIAVERKGAQVASATHIRYRHYMSDAVWTVALRVKSLPTEALAQALRYPARPLFIGRKCCLPAGRIIRGIVDADDVLAALKAIAGPAGARSAIWPADIDHGDPARIEQSRDLRDWEAGVHTGSRAVRRGTILTAT